MSIADETRRGDPAWGRHAGALLVLAAFAAWSTYPLVRHLGDAIPGTGPMDNVTFLWNAWWFEHAREDGLPLFRTPMLFAPFGTQLVLHTHTVLQSWLAQGLRPFASLTTAHNVVLLLGLAANGIGAYALAFWYVRQVLPSLGAGLLFAGSAFVQLRLLGHFNLLHAWVIPVYALALAAFLARPSLTRTVCVAAAAAAVTYTDYYYALYCALLTAIWLASSYVAVDVFRRTAPFRRIAALCLVVLALTATLIAVVLATGGGTIAIAGVPVSVRNVRNPLTLLWTALAGYVLARYVPRIDLRRRARAAGGPAFGHFVLIVAVYAILVAPVLYHSVQLVRAGEYVSQPVRWRSSPPGADLATMLLGNPRHLMTGTGTASLYRGLDIDLMEQGAWIGAVPLVVLLGRWRWLSNVTAARLWIGIGAVFLLLALGPSLRAGGVDTALPLPYAVLRYVPLVSNARIPGRAIVMVQLAAAMLTALALGRHANDERGRERWLLAALLALECLPAAVPLYLLPRPDAIDAHLRADSGEGAVVELPMGVRDGFGEIGSLDHRALVHQIAHGRPLAGGFVARLAPAVRAHVVDSPFFAALLDASRPGANDPRLPPHAVDEAAALGIRYLIVNRDTDPSFDGLTREAIEATGFRFVVAAGARELYAGR